MREIRGKQVLTFDIETTGLSAIDNEYFTAVAYDGKDKLIMHDLNDLYTLQMKYDWDKWIIATYNGQNYHGGFDFPFLRTQMINKQMKWPFTNFWHIDFLPIIKKYFNTSINETQIDSVSSLYKADLVELAEANGIEYTNKQETYAALEGLENCDWLDHKKEQTKSHNDMQSVYQYYFDQECNETYISGEDVPDLIAEGKGEIVTEHCINDVVRLYKLIDRLIHYLPDEVLYKHTEQL